LCKLREAGLGGSGGGGAGRMPAKGPVVLTTLAPVVGDTAAPLLGIALLLRLLIVPDIFVPPSSGIVPMTASTMYSRGTECANVFARAHAHIASAI